MRSPVLMWSETVSSFQPGNDSVCVPAAGMRQIDEHVRATLLHAEEEATPAREHGDANLLVLGADVTEAATAERILATFLGTAAQGERYATRRERLAALDISGI